MKKQTKPPHSLIHQPSGSVLCVQIPRRCMLQQCLATFDAGAGLSFTHSRGAVFALCKVELIFIFHTPPPPPPFLCMNDSVNGWESQSKRVEIFVY